MIKNFCDICGGESTDYSKKSISFVARAFNERHQINNHYALRQVKVTINAEIVDRDGDVKANADICSSCLSSMLHGTFYIPTKENK